MQRTIEEELARNGHSFFPDGGGQHGAAAPQPEKHGDHPGKKGALKKYDVALYHRPTGEYVLHRVLKVLDGAYVICGDNRIWKETVPEAWVIGVMTDYYPDERDRPISCSSEVYQRYLKTLRRRYWLLWMRAFPGRVRRKMISLVQRWRKKAF